MPKRIVLFLAIFLLVIGWTIASPFLQRTELETRSVNTSLSVSPFGYKALYLLLGQLQQKPVTLWEHSMMRLPLDEPKTIWFLEPGPGLFFDGEEYGQQMQALVAHGYHLIFVLNGSALTVDDSADKKKDEKAPSPKSILDYLNNWYDLGLALDSYDLEDQQSFAVKSAFAERQIAELIYEKPVDKLNTLQRMGASMEDLEQGNKAAALMVFHTFGYGTSESLVTLANGEPVAMQFQQGKGTITVFPNSFFFQNAQLDKGDNAALAMAIQEQFPDQPILFEVYSSGFNDNKDVISYLASGKGVLLLITAVLLLAGFCLFIANRPVRKVYALKTSDDRYFTQEAFIDALSQHYLSTGRWYDLYRKLLAHFQTELEQMYPGLTDEERLHVIAQNPFLEVSLKELEGIFMLKNITTEEAFIQKSQILLEVQRKVCRYEHNRADVRSPLSAKSRR